MRSRAWAALVAIATAMIAVGGCDYQHTLRLVTAPEPRAMQLGEDIADVLRRGGFRIESTPGRGAEQNLAMLQREEADLAIVENSTPWTQDIRSLLPLSRNVLHILHRRGAPPRDLEELVTGKRVYAGAPGSMGQRLLRTVLRLRGIPEESFELVEEAGVGDPDVVVLFAPVTPALAATITEHYEFFAVDAPDQVGSGSLMEGIALLYPQLAPFVIPRAIYGAANPEPVVTLATTTLLVARGGVDRELAHDLVAYLVAHKSEVARDEPSLFTGIREDFDPDDLNFPLHPGARDFVERDHPTFLERYAELGGVSFSIVLALGSGLVAISQRRSYVKKQRIDQYYEAVLRIQAESLRFSTPEEVRDATERIRQLQREAFDALIDEQVAADESFRIFVRLANDTVAELERGA